jgi:hypothetical protein
MTKEEQVIIKRQFDKSVKYLNSLDKEDSLFVDKYLQELGHVRDFIHQLGVKKSTLHSIKGRCDYGSNSK